MICRFTYYPRKGTITHLGVKIASSSTIATYPRKGTITEYFFLKLDHFTHCNLSPQGDDNAQKSDAACIADRIATYPRKGTITLVQCTGQHTRHHCNLSPQGDDN